MSPSPSRQHQFGSGIALGSVRNMVSMLLFLPLQSSLFLPIPRYAPPIRPGLPCCLFTSCSRKYHAPVRFGYVRSDPLPDPIRISVVFPAAFLASFLRHSTTFSSNLTILINHETYHRVIATCNSNHKQKPTIQMNLNGSKVAKTSYFPLSTLNHV